MYLSLLKEKGFLVVLELFNINSLASALLLYLAS